MQDSVVSVSLVLEQSEQPDTRLAYLLVALVAATEE